MMEELGSKTSQKQRVFRLRFGCCALFPISATVRHTPPCRGALFWSSRRSLVAWGPICAEIWSSWKSPTECTAIISTYPFAPC